MFVACDNSGPKPVANSNAVNTSQNSARPETVIAHSTENKTAPMGNSGTKTKWTQSGDPIDTKSLDAAIADADKALKAKPSDDELKSALAQAYFGRAMALTEARQYASALGDYRRALKLEPNHQESQKWADQILSIYQMLKKDAPKEGEEPPPLPFKKQA